MKNYNEFLEKLPTKIIQRMLECDRYYKSLTDVQRDELIIEYSSRFEDELLANYLG